MQEALKNPHYKKIWEKVEMNRKKQFESIKRHFYIEYNPLYEKGCLFLYNNILHSVIDFGTAEHWHKNGLCQSKPIVSALKCDTAKETLHKLVDEVYVSTIDEILGRPITLEDILILFGKTFSQTLNAYKFVQLTCEGAFITMQPIEHPLHRIEVILGKPLHEQTPETWEKIANLID